MTELMRVAAFPSAGELALHVADERGHFAAEDLSVEIHDVRGSRQQFAGLRDGSWDVLHTAADNVLAYRDEGLDAAIVLGVNRGLLSLVAAAGVTSVEDLRGRPIGVDSAGSGYAVVLRHVLRLAGLPPEAAELVEVGGTRERARALEEHEIAATLLTPPYSVEALRRGCGRLLRPTDHVPRYLGATVTVLRPWAAEHDETLRRYVRATLAALAWLRDPAHRTELLPIVSERMGVASALAADVLDEVLAPAAGLLPGGRVERADVDAVLDVRRQAGRAVAPAAGDCLDLSHRP